MALVNVEGSVMSGVPGFSSRLFTALRNEKISVILISQASSEYSICFAVPEKQAGRAEKTLRSEFSSEIQEKGISKIETELGSSIIAAVGEGMPVLLYFRTQNYENFNLEEVLVADHPKPLDNTVICIVNSGNRVPM